MKTVAVVPSAGIGTRIKSRTAKPYIELAGKPILAHTLEALNNTSCIDEIIVAVDKASKIKAASLAKKYKIKKLKKVVCGGATRFDSVSNCLKELGDDVGYVVIHDGVRPFITENIIKKAIKVAKKTGACVVGVPLVPTAKKIDKNLKVVFTPSRKELWAAQTPQVFKKSIIVKAYKSAKNNGTIPTDDSMLVELLGKPVKMVMGSEYNIKITTPLDLELANLLIKKKLVK
ncbi:MAG: 2-C-methyl-D-erythritol 4-phosphate cytidylyltransferase [Candidatus Omnitrophica bacterium CG07_land_8_20_14_0_80_42_15]|uniref:2-C-methyl-D-erythritol 4-phosphate cytidylyltransferase n=1 Tax=Candidatus Aquitaenariimonas noxiae TaxID=1974741 RepID=A0A2J0L4A1_9BACT|nr:MAG: 2-C-methyl-D-erythritol 4-phosphate cytidylyltransferase [Candidatus Omnitrophica bacterium CG07_land_8_20_14_0_80_42_15]